MEEWRCGACREHKSASKVLVQVPDRFCSALGACGWMGRVGFWGVGGGSEHGYLGTIVLGQLEDRCGSGMLLLFPRKVPT